MAFAGHKSCLPERGFRCSSALAGGQFLPLQETRD